MSFDLNFFNTLSAWERDDLRLRLTRLEGRPTRRRGRRRGLFRQCLTMNLKTVYEVFQFIYLHPDWLQHRQLIDVYHRWLKTQEISPHIWDRADRWLKTQTQAQTQILSLSWYHGIQRMLICEQEDECADWPPARLTHPPVLYFGNPAVVCMVDFLGLVIDTRDTDTDTERMGCLFRFNPFTSTLVFTKPSVTFSWPGAHCLYTEQQYAEALIKDRQLFDSTAKQVKDVIYTHEPNFHADLFSIIFDYVLPVQLRK